MKKTTKVLLSSIATIAMTASVAVGGTLALFTDQAAVSVAVTSGKVDVEALIDQASLKTFSRGIQQPDGYFANDAGNAKGATFTNGVLSLNNITPGDKAKFSVNVTNGSNVDIQYRTVVYVTGSLANFIKCTATADAWTYVEGGAAIAPVEVVVELPEDVTYEKLGNISPAEYNAKVAVTIEAIQGNGDVSGKVSVANVQQLQNVLDNASGDVEIKLANDLELTADIIIPVGANVALDMNGKTISASDTYADTDGTALIYNKGALKLSNGTINAVQATAIRNHGANASLTLDAMTIEQSTATNTEWLGSAVFTSGNATTVINSGTYAGVSSAAIVATSGGHLIINGGTFTADVTTIRADSWNYGSKVTINDGTFNVAVADAKALYADGYKYVEINGGTFNGTIDSTYTPITLNGGTFTKSIKQNGGHQNYYVINGGTYVDNLSVSISNNTKVNGTVTDNGDGTYTVAITAEDLKDLISAGGDIVLVGDVDLGGATVAIPDGTTIKGGTVQNVTFTVADECTAAFEGVTFEGGTAIRTVEDGALKFIDCTFNTDPANLVGNSRASSIIGSNQYYTMDLYLDGCTFNYSEDSADPWNNAIFMWTSVNQVTIKNCVFNDYGFVAIKFMNVAEGANIVFEGNTFNMCEEGTGQYWYNNAIQIVPQHDKTFTVTLTNNVFNGDYEMIDGEECLVWLDGMNSGFVLSKLTLNHSGNIVNGEAAVDANFPVGD